MAAFARFVMRHNGLAIHIAINHITQIRETSDAVPAIYLTGKDTPLMVEGDVDEVLRRLEAAAAGAPVPEAAPEAEPDPVELSPAKPAKARKTRASKAKASAGEAPVKIALEEPVEESSWFMGAR